MGMIQQLQFNPAQADWESWMTELQIWAGNIDNLTNQLPMTAQQMGGYIYPPSNAEQKLGLNTGLNLIYPWGHVFRYGAKGDGTTDDWQAITDAISVAGYDNLVTVQIPGATFAITKALHMKSGVTMVGVGYNSVIMWQNGVSLQDNMLKFESIQYASVEGIRLNGNRINVTNSQYGCYFGQALSCKVQDCYTHSFNGDGIHCFNSNFVTISRNFSFDNVFHGIEVEKSQNIVVSDNQCTNNQANGIYVYLGLINNIGDNNYGCQNVTISGNTLSANTQYGIGVQGNLCYNISIIGNNIRANGQYGLTLFDQVKGCAVMGNSISYNGANGIYLYRATYNVVVGNVLRANSQNINGGYQEIFLDGDSATPGFFSAYNLVEGNQIIMDATFPNGTIGANVAAYGIKEANTLQGPNIIRGNSCPIQGQAGTIAYLNVGTFALADGNTGRVDRNGGTTTFNGDAATVSFAIAHGLNPDEPRIAQVTAGSPDAAGPFSIASDPTNIIVTFITPPKAGTGNVILRWYASIGE